jgi:amino acid transporter
VAAIMTLVQIVALGTLPGLAASTTPIASAAAVFLGAAGAALMTFGATVSASGNNMGQALSGTRNLFALAEHGDIPAFFGRVHPRFRTPVTAVIVTAAVSLVLALSGGFAALAAVSAISRLVVYVFTCAATIRLRNPRFAATVRPAVFTVPLGPLIPTLAIVIGLAILAGATPQQRKAGALALLAGAALYAVVRMTPSAGRQPAAPESV